MILALFWIKIALNRTWAAIKSSFALVIASAVIVGAFVFAFAGGYISIDAGLLITLAPILMLVSLLDSFRKRDALPALLLYSKSKLANSRIQARFFLKEALLSNAFLIIVVVINFFTAKKYPWLALLASFFSLSLSFLIMQARNRRSRRPAKSAVKKSLLSAQAKGFFHDYCAGDVLVRAIFCAAIFFTAFLILALDPEITLFDPGSGRFQAIFFIAALVAFFFGFLGLADFPHSINWKFHAILGENSFTFHVKRTARLSGLFFGWLLAVFIFIGLFMNIALMLKYLYCIIALYFTIFGLSFARINPLMKTALLFGTLALVFWAGSLPFWLLPAPAIAALLALRRAKHEYKDWYQL
ncbi:MAG: hypothetical protein FWE09_00535 [Treponema sp.]|nr:hypothetical protein [Treponema sp.]